MKNILTIVITTLSFFNYLVSFAYADEILFEDNFSGIEQRMPDGTHKLYPDRTKWAFTFWPGIKWPESYGDGTNWLESNDESQTYVTPFISKVRKKVIPISLRYDPFSIQKDGLHITAALLTPQQQKAYDVGGHRRFGSGMILSRTTFTFGKVTMIAKLPSARGTWPAFWFLPAVPQWPPEIDPLEGMAWGSHSHQIHSGYLTQNSERDEYPSFGEWFDVGVNPSENFHEYTLEWDETNISAYFDKKILWQRPTPPSMKQPMYIIINLAVGGKWAFNELNILPIDGRTPERLNRGSDLIQNDFPSDMIIRSVKITQ
jgi:hypothetical protein